MNRKKLVISGIVVSLVLVLGSTAEAQETVRGSTHFILKTILQNQNDIDTLEKRVSVLEQYINAVESNRVAGSLIGQTLLGQAGVEIGQIEIESTPGTVDIGSNQILTEIAQFADIETPSTELTITVGQPIYNIGDVIMAGGNSKTSIVQMRVSLDGETIYDYKVFGNAKRGWYATNIATANFEPGVYLLTVTDEGESREVPVELRTSG